MTTPLRVGTFNVNQFDSKAEQTADLLHLLRSDQLDALCVQECVHADLANIAAGVPGWSAWQEHAPAGKANTGVLYRTSLGAKSHGHHYLIDAADTRPRYVAWVAFRGYVIASAHRLPERDKALWLRQDRNLGVFAHGKRVIVGIDTNTRAHGPLEARTGLTWHGEGIDGFLTNLNVSHVARMPREHSDHRPVVAVFKEK